MRSAKEMGSWVKVLPFRGRYKTSGFFCTQNSGSGAEATTACALPFRTSCSLSASLSNWRSWALGKNFLAASTAVVPSRTDRTTFGSLNFARSYQFGASFLLALRDMPE